MPDRPPVPGEPAAVRLRDELALISATLRVPLEDLAGDDRRPVVVPWPHEPRASE